MVTIRDVARTAGVSLATVSRVAQKPHLVAARTRQRVEEVIEALGYAPNPAAASLRTLRTGKIIVTVPNIANPFFSRVLQGIERTAQRAGYSLLLGNTGGNAEKEDRYGTMLLRREADGLIFLGPRLPESLKAMIERDGASAPIVGACEFSPALGVSGVYIDNEAAAYVAMEALYELGHVRVAVVSGPPSSPINVARLVGAQKAADRYGRRSALTVATGSFSAYVGRRLARDVLASKAPTAIFCFSDELAFGAMAAVRSAGLSCPEDISIIGFDDVDMARYVYPALTTIRQPMRAIGTRAAELLLGILSGRPESPATICLPHRMIVRCSVGPPPAKA